MIYQRYLKILFAVTALTGCFLSLALAGEPKQGRLSQGNNLQWDVSAASYAGPITRSGGQSMFPKGSGNIYTNDGFCFVPCTARDLDGDGVAEDTVILSNGRGGQGRRMAIEDAQLLADIHAQGLFVWAEVGKIQYVRCWSTLDEDDLTDWPPGGRVGRNPSGEIIQYGAETMFTMTTAALEGGYVQPGVLMEWQFFFLDYGESNNMVYIHTKFTNITEYMKYHQDKVFREIGQAHPNGWDWNGFSLLLHLRGVSTYGEQGRRNLLGYAYHPAKEIIGQFSTLPQVSGFSPPEPAMYGLKVLKFPGYKDETMKLTNVVASTWQGSEFGISGSMQLVLRGYAYPQTYLGTLGKLDQMPGVISPFTGRHHNSYPGMLEPTDARYNQWIWGAHAWVINPCWSELHDVAPRDTTSMDWVIFFTYPGVKPLETPTVDIANIDDPMMQEALFPFETYAEVARSVYEGGYILPSSPRAPVLTIIPGDRQVTITWSSVNLNTPDSYYYFLQDNDLDPLGRYKEYDFEGFRFYRSFVGPNDSHSKPLGDFNLSEKNLQFYYVDKLDDDTPYKRMRNGLKIWYALQAYDLNYDVATGDPFSLPPPESGKSWNIAEAGLYGVVPRSNASNYRAAEVDGEIVFHPLAGTPSSALSAELQAPGDGTLTDPPVYLEPVVKFEFQPVVNEKIASAKTLFVNTIPVFNVTGTGNSSDSRSFQIADGSSLGIESSKFTVRNRNGASLAHVVLEGLMDSDGSIYSVICDFEYMSDGDFRSNLVMNMNTGDYTGAAPGVYSSDSRGRYQGGRTPAHPGQIHAGRFTLTWKAGLTLEVKDVSSNSTVNFVEFPDDYGWGFVTIDQFGGTWSGRGPLYDDMRNKVPYSDRTAKMVSTLPADNTEEFAIWVNGLLWVFKGSDEVIDGMPSAGTVFTIDNAFGEWNEDKTVFTQWPDPPFPGDKWEIKIKPSTLKPEDADLSKVRVVPNPYIATSYLDMSPTNRRIEFVNLPDRCTIRIYTLSGNLVNVLSHIGANRQGWGNYTDWDRLNIESEPRVFTGYDNTGGTEQWNMRNRFGQTVASGLYLYHVTDQRGQTHTGKFYIIN